MPAKINPQMAESLMKQKGFKILEPYPGAHKPWKSICLKCQNEVSPTYYSVKTSKKGCKYCSKRKVSEKEAIRTMLNSNLRPLETFKTGRSKWKCECLKCRKLVTPTYSDIKSGYGGCKYCAKSYVDPKEAEEKALLLNLQPLEPYSSSGKPWKCKCLLCNKIVNPRYDTMRTRGSGCKYCAKRFIDEEDAIKTMRANDLEPLSAYLGANKPWKSKCIICERVVTPRLNGIKRGQSGCVYCSGKKVDPYFAEEFMKKNNLQPLEPFFKAMQPWKCRCLRCGKVVTPTYASIGQGQKGCVFCAGNKVDPIDARNLFIKNNLEPLEPFQHSEKKWKSKCMKCNKIVSPTYHQISQKSGGCKYCANYGLDFNKPVFIYLMTNQKLNSHKIGIGGEFARENRISEHAREGWILYKKMTIEVAEEAYELEQRTLRWLRDEMKFPPYLSNEQMPQSGWTETVDADLISLPSIWSKIEELSIEKNNFLS